MAKEKTKETKYVETPLMKQYYGVKAVHGDAILLFRGGDFYETFGEDAIRASRILGITLTRRANGSASFVELAGFPYHAIDTYLPRWWVPRGRSSFPRSCPPARDYTTIMQSPITSPFLNGTNTGFRQNSCGKRRLFGENAERLRLPR